MTLVRTSSSPRAFSSSPVGKSATSMERSPPGPVTFSVAPRAVSTVGESDCGSPWDTLPPMVARLRTVGSPTCAAASASSGACCFTMSDDAISAKVVSAPMQRPPSAASMPLSAPMCPMSTSTAGVARRSFIIGIRLWPPASTFAPSLSARSCTASATEPALWYVVCAGYMASLRSARLG